MTRRERTETLPNGLGAVQGFVRDHVRALGHNSRAAMPAGGVA